MIAEENNLSGNNRTDSIVQNGDKNNISDEDFQKILLQEESGKGSKMINVWMKDAEELQASQLRDEDQFETWQKKLASLPADSSLGMPNSEYRVDLMGQASSFSTMQAKDHQLLDSMQGASKESSGLALVHKLDMAKVVAEPDFNDELTNQQYD